MSQFNNLRYRNFLINVYIWLITVLAGITWALIGLIFWIPLMMQEIALFCSALISTVISENHSYFELRRTKLERVLGLIKSGYANINAIRVDIPVDKSNVLPFEHYLKIFLMKYVWISIFWAIIGSLILIF